MIRFLQGKKAIAAAVLFTVLLTVLKIFQLDTAVEYPTGFIAVGGEALNIVFNCLLGAAAVVITLLCVFDLKNRQADNDSLSKSGAGIIGVTMILAGAALSISVINEFTAGMSLLTLFTIAACAAYIIGGVTIFVNGKISPAHCICAIIVIICYIIKCITYYLSNPIIVVMPQKLMLMLFYVMTVLFWINMGRIMSGGAKKLTKYAAVASGLFCAVTSFANNIGGMVFAAVSPEKWAQLGDTADIELIITGLVPGVIAAALLICGGGKSDEQAAVKEEKTAENAESIADASDDEEA